MSILGSRIKDLRKRDNMTKKNLGELVNVTKVSICCYENGTRTPTLETLVDLADVLNTRITTLIATDYFAVSEEDEEYTLNIAKDELAILKSLRNHTKLYEMLLEEPKRTLDYLEQKVR